MLPTRRSRRTVQKKRVFTYDTLGQPKINCLKASHLGQKLKGQAFKSKQENDQLPAVVKQTEYPSNLMVKMISLPQKYVIKNEPQELYIDEYGQTYSLKPYKTTGLLETMDHGACFNQVATNLQQSRLLNQDVGRMNRLNPGCQPYTPATSWNSYVESPHQQQQHVYNHQQNNHYAPYQMFTPTPYYN